MPSLPPRPPPPPAASMSPYIFKQKAAFLFVSAIFIIVLIVLFFIFHIYTYSLRQNRRRNFDVEERIQAAYATRLFRQFQLDMVRQRQLAAGSQWNAAEREPSSAVTTVAYKDMIKTIEEEIADSSAVDKCCVVCIEGFEEEEICRVVERCGHFFHQNCMDQWVRIERRCPLCRCLVHVVPHNINNPHENQPLA